jgi:8-oxo-dGTP diphosphatase
MDQGAPLSVTEILDDNWQANRLYPSFPRLATSIAVFRRDRVLLATRTKPPYVGLFSLPGGVVELGETLAEAALRELREEVAVEARIIGFNRHVEAVERDQQGLIRHHYVIASFVAEWVSGEGSEGPEAGSIIWALPAELPGLATTPNVIQTIESARALRSAKAP